MSILEELLGGGDKTTTTTNQLTPEQQEFMRVQTELARLQLGNLQNLQPFQRRLINESLADLNQNNRDERLLNRLVTPADRARLQAEEFERMQRLGPMQDEVMRLQLEQLRNGGRATPEQLRDIRGASRAAIRAGTADIDRETERGLGLISDELANSRGLRMTDTPILREATLLARDANDQKTSLIRGIRSNEANARLNYPLAVQQLQGSMNLQQQGLFQNAAQFQADLRNRAFQNRMASTSQASNTGLGMASFGGQNTQSPGSTSTTSGGGMNLGGLGQLLSGAAAGYGAYAAFAASDRRIKDDYGVVAKTKGGLPLHIFRYKGESKDAPLRLGVMAQETERLFPDAVVEDETGLKIVDYRKVA